MGRDGDVCFLVWVLLIEVCFFFEDLVRGLFASGVYLILFILDLLCVRRFFFNFLVRRLVVYSSRV